MTSEDAASDEKRIRELHDGWVRANGEGDIGWLRAHIADGPDEYVMWNTMGSNFFGQDGIVALWEQLVEMAAEVPDQETVSRAWDQRIDIGGDLAVVTYLHRLVVDFGPRDPAGDGPLDETCRGTEVYRRVDGDWKMIHYHGSPHQPGLMGGS